MIKARRKVNKAFIVNNIRLCMDLNDWHSPVYINLVTGKQYGFANRRRLKLKDTSPATIQRLRDGHFGAGHYPNLVTISG